MEVEVRAARLRRTRRRGLTIVEATVADESGPAKAVWFNQAWLAERLRPGTRLLLYGKLDRSRLSRRGARVRRRRGGAGIHTTGVVPVHPATERLRPQRLREWAWQAQPLARTRSSRCRRSFALAAGWPAWPTRCGGSLPRRPRRR